MNMKILVSRILRYDYTYHKKGWIFSVSFVYKVVQIRTECSLLRRVSYHVWYYRESCANTTHNIERNDKRVVLSGKEHIAQEKQMWNSVADTIFAFFHIKVM